MPNNLKNFTKTPVRDVVEGDTLYWEYKDDYGYKKVTFAKVIGLTQGKKRLLGPRKIHLMVSAGGSTLVGDRAASELIWVMNREPEL